MGKRSRKRPAAERAGETRAERDARRRAAAAAPVVARRATRERPPPPWGSFPLSELVILLAIVLGVIGFITFDHPRGRIMVLAGMVLGSLGGLEVSIREHFGGFRSHTTLLAGSTAVLAMIAIAFAGGKSDVARLVVVPAGGIVFMAAFWLFRTAFKRRSGGLGFR
ncbi:MAG: hypothetical protein ACJ76Z_09440 [Thermoleophilaceae bacterium]